MSKESYYSQLRRGEGRLLRQPVSERNPHKLGRIQAELQRITDSKIGSRLFMAERSTKPLRYRDGEIITCDTCSKNAIGAHFAGIAIPDGLAYAFYCEDHGP